MTDVSMPPSSAWGGDPGVPAGDRILVDFAGPAAQNRLTVLVRWILALPHLVVLVAIGVAAWAVLVVSWFAALFTGRVPAGMADFLAGYLSWAVRVQAYLYLLTDRYPPFALGDVDYPVRVLVRPERLNRLTVLFRLILAIPAFLLSGLVSYGAGTIMAFVTWLIVLVSGRMPAALHQAYAAFLRYYARTAGYLMLLTGAYPSGLFGDSPGAQVPGITPQPGAGEPAGPGVPGFTGTAAHPDPFGQPAGPGAAEPSRQPDPGAAWAVPETTQGAPAGQAGRPEIAGAASWAMPGTPEGAAPGYGQFPSPPPWSGAPQAPPPAQPWRLLLSAAAKRLVALFIVLGALTYAGEIAVIIATVAISNTVLAADASVQIQADHAQLLTAITKFDSTVRGCGSDLTCVTRADAQAASALGLFGRRLASVAVPGTAQQPDSQLQAVTASLESAFHQLASSKSVAQYEQTVASTHLTQNLSQFDVDYQRLTTSLAR